MRKGKRKAPYANLIFWLPIVLVVVLVIFALTTLVLNQTSTVVIRAMTSGRYSPQVSLRASYTMGGVTGFTPSNQSVGQGEQTIVFGALPWYKTPSPLSFYLPGGKTYYATAVYSPILAGFAITSQGLNATKVTALHGVTPVVWLNQGSSVAILEFQDGSRALIPPSQNYTRVFSLPGDFTFGSLSGGLAGEVVVQ